MPPLAAPERFARIMAIVMEYDRRGPVPIAELTDRFDLSADALAKDLDRLQWCGVPPFYAGCLIEAYVDDDAGTVDILVPDQFARRARLTGGEGVALLTAARTVLALRPGDEVLARAIDEACAQLDIGGDLLVSIEHPALLDVFLDGEERSVVMTGRYWTAYRDAVSDRRLEPHAVFFAGGTWYARCRDCGDGTMKLFRVDRFETASSTDESFDPTPAAESLALFDPGDAAEKVTVRFPVEARWVTETLEVTVTADDESGITATLHAVGTSWLENLLLRTAGRVVAPAHLTDVGPAAARRALARYDA